MSACREALLGLYSDYAPQNGENAGLLLARYLKDHALNPETPEVKAREKLLGAAVSALNKIRGSNPNFYKLAFARRGAALGGTSAIFKIAGRIAVGFGDGGVLEAGAALNHLYGTPVIPGSALKGLAAHYCSAVWGKELGHENFASTGEDYKFMFGDSEDAGFLAFHDAWLTPSSMSGALVHDVLTPHHGSYYGGKGESAPTEFDAPNPITFLSVKGEFEIRVTCEGIGEDWEQVALKLLKQALGDWGIGGKTSSGYGILK